MGIEIERKFLLLGSEWKQLAKGVDYRQGYLNTVPGRTVRVRTAGTKGFLTIKGPTRNSSRLEYEYEIPYGDACEMLERLVVSPVIEKKRYTVHYRGFNWEIDEFFGENADLTLAEIELATVDQQFTKPEWVGREVTDDPRYYNSSLAQNPYSRWKDDL